MKTITVKEALEQGYELCGYQDLECQSLMNISDLSDEDFETNYNGKLCVAHKEPNSATVSSEEVIEWLVDRYFDTDGNPDDDTNDMELCFKEEKEVIEEFVLKMNNVYSKKQWRFLTDLQIVP